MILELFHAAIMQSGHALFYALYNTGKEAAFAMGKNLNKNFSGNSADLLQLLQAASTTDIFQVF